MAATASFNNATKIVTVASDGLPRPVSYGTFPNENNPNTVTEQDFDHDFLYRGGTFGPTRTCLLYTSPSPRDRYISRMPSSA